MHSADLAYSVQLIIITKVLFNSAQSKETKMVSRLAQVTKELEFLGLKRRLLDKCEIMT